MVQVKMAAALVMAMGLLLLIAPSRVAAEGRKLSQMDSNCDDCACAKVECAKYCESANNIDSFTCDESGWFSQGQFYCTCQGGSSGGSSQSSGARAIFKSAAAIGILSATAFVFVF